MLISCIQLVPCLPLAAPLPLLAPAWLLPPPPVPSLLALPPTLTSKVSNRACATTVSSSSSMLKIRQKILGTQSPILADSKPIAGVKGTFSERTFIAVKVQCQIFKHTRERERHSDVEIDEKLLARWRSARSRCQDHCPLRGTRLQARRFEGYGSL